MAPTPVWRKQAGCEGKQGFDTHAMAVTVAHRASHRRHARIAPYICPHCRKWHIGGKDK